VVSTREALKFKTTNIMNIIDFAGITLKKSIPQTDVAFDATTVNAIYNRVGSNLDRINRIKNFYRLFTTSISLFSNSIEENTNLNILADEGNQLANALKTYKGEKNFKDQLFIFNTYVLYFEKIFNITYDQLEKITGAEVSSDTYSKLFMNAIKLEMIIHIYKLKPTTETTQTNAVRNIINIVTTTGKQSSTIVKVEDILAGVGNAKKIGTTISIFCDFIKAIIAFDNKTNNISNPLNQKFKDMNINREYDMIKASIDTSRKQDSQALRKSGLTIADMEEQFEDIDENGDKITLAKANNEDGDDNGDDNGDEDGAEDPDADPEDGDDHTGD
jgi:hypothetical protein